MYLISLAIIFNILGTPSIIARLNSDEVREVTLREIVSGELQVSEEDKRRTLVKTLGFIIQNRQIERQERIYAIRSLGVIHDGTDILAKILSEEDRTVETIALSREAARALSAFAPPKFVSKWYRHPDPVVRSIFLRMGADSQIHCEHLKTEPWSFVRQAIVEGMTTSENSIVCVLKALDDPHNKVRRAAIDALGELAPTMSPALRAQSQKRLRLMVKDSDKEKLIRIQSMVALGRLQDCTAAHAALKIYLDSGALAFLVNASFGALQQCGELSPYYEFLIRDQNPHLVQLSFRHWLKQDSKNACQHISDLPTAVKHAQNREFLTWKRECINTLKK